MQTCKHNLTFNKNGVILIVYSPDGGVLPLSR